MATYIKGGHKGYGSTEPGYARDAYPSHLHHPIIANSDGQKHEIIFAEYRNDQKYVGTVEEVIEFRHRPGGGAAGLGLGRHSNSPPGKDRPGGSGAVFGLGGQKNGRGTTHVPWRKTTDHRDNPHGSPTKGHGHEMGHGGSPRYNNRYSPNNGVHNHTMHPRPHNYAGSSSEDEDGSDHDDVVCKDGVCLPKPKHGAMGNVNHGNDYGNYDKPKPQVKFSEPYYDQNPNNNHHFTRPRPSSPVSSITPSYPVHNSSYNKPKPNSNYSDPYYDKNPNHNHHYYARSPPKSHTRPLPTPHPIKDASTYARPKSNSPPQTRTGPDYNRPNYQEYPRHHASKAHPDTIDSSEAKRKYGGVTVHTENHTEPKYNGPTIDCRTAAEKYNGIFVPGNNF